jgi:hypothetical protein
MSCTHDLDAEYLYPADATVAERGDGEVQFTVVLSCPGCDEPLEVTATPESVAETDLPLPMDDSADPYD